jgi:hypothetical protein
MVAVLSGDTMKTTEPDGLAAFIEVFWNGLKPLKSARRKPKRRA